MSSSPVVSVGLLEPNRSKAFTKMGKKSPGEGGEGKGGIEEKPSTWERLASL